MNCIVLTLHIYTFLEWMGGQLSFGVRPGDNDSLDRYQLYTVGISTVIVEPESVTITLCKISSGINSLI